jgi:hypothetical protein
MKLQSHSKINTKKSSCLTKKKQILCCQINHLAQDFLTLYELCKLINDKYTVYVRKGLTHRRKNGEKRLHCFQNSSLFWAVQYIGNFMAQQEKIFAVIVLIFLLYVPYDYIIKNDNDYCRESITMFPGDTVPLRQLWQRNCHQPGLKLYVKPSTAREICLHVYLLTRPSGSMWAMI